MSRFHPNYTPVRNVILRGSRNKPKNRYNVSTLSIVQSHRDENPGPIEAFAAMDSLHALLSHRDENPGSIEAQRPSVPLYVLIRSHRDENPGSIEAAVGS